MVTIDPAKRLANALGLQELENEPRRVEPEPAGRATGSRSGRAVGDDARPQADVRRADRPDRRPTPSAPRRSRQTASTASCRPRSRARRSSPPIAKLYELDRDGDFDLLVLDTPPSRNALDFLDAPGRLTSFLEGRALKAFMRPTGLGHAACWAAGAAPLLGGAAASHRRRSAHRPLHVLPAARGHDRRLQRAGPRRCEEMLRAPTTAFVLVTSAQPRRSRRRSGFAARSRRAGCRSPA